MFSSLASFLPTALRETTRASSFVPDNDEPTIDRQLPPPTEVPREQTEPRKRDRERRHNEIFIVVRPPPSKTNHPLNLQVQLVPPHSRGVLPRQSIDFESGNTPLHRTSSTRSQESASTYGSTASFGSTTTTATTSTTASRRAIVPLYNLQAHNVLPNVIVDAGTDAKVAKFQKRGIELIDLAVFEPVEVWPDSTAVIVPSAVSTLTAPIVGPGASTSTLGRLSMDEAGFAQVHAGSVPGRSAPPFLSAPTNNRLPTTQDPNTATSSSASLSSTSQLVHQLVHSPIQTQVTPPNSSGLPSGNNRRNIFGKIFKKTTKDTVTSPSSQQSLKQVPRPQSISQETPETLNDDLNGTPTQMQHMRTPTPQHQNLSPKDMTPESSNGKRAGGLRGSWLLGSSGLSPRPQSAASPSFASAFSSLSLKRRPTAGSQAVDNMANNLNMSQADDEAQVPQSTGASHVHACYQPNQIQAQNTLGVQPTLVVVHPSFVKATRGTRCRRSKSPNSETRGSVEIRNDNIDDTKPCKEKVKPFRRPYIYAWLGRKWIKRRPAPQSHGQGQHKGLGLGLNLGGTGTGFGIDASRIHTTKDREVGVEETVEVRFEWKRMPVSAGSKKRPDAGASNEARESSAEGDEQGSAVKSSRRRRASTSRDAGSRWREGEGKTTRKDGGFDGQVERVRKPSASSITSARAAAKRLSLASHQSQSTTGVSEENSVDADAEDESDPEDSETPWVCTLKVRRTNAGLAKEAGMSLIPSNTSSKEARGRSRRQGDAVGNGGIAKSHENTPQDVLRIKVGTLSPTPHHPKVVAMLKMPFPLPDVQVERLGVVKRRGLAPSSQSEGGSEKPDYYGLTLTGEEIKDIVCSTSLWLVVRENIGGVGKVQRKGDGWMIRA
ncbi:hypothetical protein APHAL10511_007618 [Amanita phalloides]|nr:hypothetical protein APHAL10511_007618 [Amanita phalloides]